MTRKKVVVRAMGKNITIDNPENIEISLEDKGCKAFKFNVPITKYGTRKLARAFRKVKVRGT